MPRSKLVKLGVWEDGNFIGCVIFGCGASNALGRPYGLGLFEVCELVRVALRSHRTPVTRIVGVAVRMLQKLSPSLRLVVSYADPAYGHVGGIYQAGNWLYTGKTAPSKVYFDARGGRHHNRNVKARSYRDRSGVVNHARSLMVRCDELEGKHRYLMPLDAEMRAKLLPLAKPYPKRCAGRVDGDSPAVQAGEGGSSPTSALAMGV